jgi:hypothetical protein
MMERFRELFAIALRTLPLITHHGRVENRRWRVQFGAPSGSHEDTDCWIYHHGGSGLEMLFAFYSNFTPNDLICKVIRPGQEVLSGEGASVQFNANQSVAESEANVFTLSHHGRVTIGRPIERETLLNAMQEAAPQAIEMLGGLQEACPNWTVVLGNTRNVGLLIDRMFFYAYGVEQAKRSLKQEELLPPLM